MQDLISRQAAIEEIARWIGYIDEDMILRIRTGLKKLPSAQPEIVRCGECKWWDKKGDSPVGYCHAAKHSCYSEHWEIEIYRTYKEDFFCADGERRSER